MNTVNRSNSKEWQSLSNSLVSEQQKADPNSANQTATKISPDVLLSFGVLMFRLHKT